MNLLYIWNDNYLNAEEKGYLLNSIYNIHFNKSEMKLHIERNGDFIEGFWGEHVFDVMAVVGENGSGKTRLANCIMDTLVQLGSTWTDKQNWYGPQFIIVFEDSIGEKNGIKIFVTSQYEKISIDSELDYKICLTYKCKEIEKFKFGYFNNVLDLNDYRSDGYDVIFDASVGGSIMKNFRHDLEMHYINSQKDKITNYYENEILQMIDFITSDLDNTKIPFVLPKYVEVALANYKVNLQYITKELDKMSESGSDFSFFDKNPSDILNESCQYIVKMPGESWRNRLVVNLLLNLFKELCIPQTTADHLESEAIEFLRVLNRIDYLFGSNSYEVMLSLLDKVENYQNEHEIYQYRKFMRRLPDIFFPAEENMDRLHKKLIFNLPTDIAIVRELFTHYKNTNFSYPYFSFNFGLSTGEFNFLKLFSKIAGLTHEDSNGEPYVENNITHKVRCENIFLYFDEVDLSMHPEWQRQCVDWILQFVDTHFKNCKVQIIITTHSPIMLSDFPKNNVLYLWKDEEGSHAEKRDIKTFGNNIHTLFMDSFFLNDAGTMGAYAEKKINAIAGDLKNVRNIKSDNTLKIIDNIGDDIIRNKLKQMCSGKAHIEEKTKQEKPDETIINSTINLIKSQIKNLESTIDELERMKE